MALIILTGAFSRHCSCPSGLSSKKLLNNFHYKFRFHSSDWDILHSFHCQFFIHWSIFEFLYKMQREYCDQHPWTFMSFRKRNNKISSKSSKTTLLVTLDSIDSVNFVNYFGTYVEWEKLSRVHSFCQDQEFCFGISVLIFTLNFPYKNAFKQINICICLKWFPYPIIWFALIYIQSPYVPFPEQNDMNHLSYFMMGLNNPSRNRRHSFN